MPDHAGEGVVVPLRPRPSQRGSAADLPAADDAEVYAFAGGEALAAHIADAADVTWDQRAAEALGFLRRRISGAYQVDEYGFDAELADAVALPAFRALYEKWFRVEVKGIEHVPSAGGALLVANHSGGLWPMDAAMTAVAVRLEHPSQRRLRMLGGELTFRIPGFGTFARRTGATLACAADAERLLRAGELVGTWPEGYRGIGKLFRDRYQVQPFGRRAFVDSAIAVGVPIIPVSIVGAEEIHPILGNAKTLARLLDLPYFPLTPTFPWLGPLGAVPFPSKWYLEFGAPVTADCDPNDAVAIAELAEHVHESIQSTLYRLLGQRRSVWR